MKHIRFDWAIKKILRDKANHAILEGFISELLQQSIKIESILESESNPLREENKFNRVDILARSTEGKLLLIEVQNSTEQDYFHRMLYGASTLIAEYLNRGEPYQNIKKVYSIHIVYFSLGRGQDYIYQGRQEFRGWHLNDRLELSSTQQELFNIKKISEIFPEYYLLKVNNFDDQTKDSIDEWLYFLKNSEIKDEFSAQGLAEAKERLREEYLSDEERATYQRYLKDKQYENSMMSTARAEAELMGWKRGKQEGEQEEKQSIAKAMKKAGSPMEFIAQVTGLSLDDVEAL
ncbi:MAG: Rpn family recombination-promoting nuclease/putative transposase [Symploca sp. SIO3E6]|nr:Rpn family recombination-promoting nuclease/putative transposase [Caldora sp. SIO3E6]